MKSSPILLSVDTISTIMSMIILKVTAINLLINIITGEGKSLTLGKSFVFALPEMPAFWSSTKKPTLYIYGNSDFTVRIQVPADNVDETIVVRNSQHQLFYEIHPDVQTWSAGIGDRGIRVDSSHDISVIMYLTILSHNATWGGIECFRVLDASTSYMIISHLENTLPQAAIATAAFDNTKLDIFHKNGSLIESVNLNKLQTYKIEDDRVDGTAVDFTGYRFVADKYVSVILTNRRPPWHSNENSYASLAPVEFLGKNHIVPVLKAGRESAGKYTVRVAAIWSGTEVNITYADLNFAFYLQQAGDMAHSAKLYSTYPASVTCSKPCQVIQASHSIDRYSDFFLLIPPITRYTEGKTLLRFANKFTDHDWFSFISIIARSTSEETLITLNSDLMMNIPDSEWTSVTAMPDYKTTVIALNESQTQAITSMEVTGIYIAWIYCFVYPGNKATYAILTSYNDQEYIVNNSITPPITTTTKAQVDMKMILIVSFLCASLAISGTISVVLCRLKILKQIQLKRSPGRSEHWNADSTASQDYDYIEPVTIARSPFTGIWDYIEILDYVSNYSQAYEMIYYCNTHEEHDLVQGKAMDSSEMDDGYEKPDIC